MKIFFLFLVLVLFMLGLRFGVARAANQASFKFTPASGTYQTGQDFPVDIQLNTDGGQVVAVSAFVLYDKTKLTAMSISTSTSAFAYEVENMIDSANGKIFITRGQPTPGVTGTAAQVARINFQALSAVNLTNISFYFTGAGVSGDSGAILNDGFGTDILTSVANAVFIINTASSSDITAPSTPANFAVISAQTNAFLSWSASKDNISVVGYKIYRDNVLIAMTTQLSYADSNLISSTSYSYGVSAYDASGNESAQSSVNTTTFANPPVISFIQATPTTNAADISWLTNTASDSQVEYGLTTAYGLTIMKDVNLTLNHSQSISNLFPNTTYHYRVISKDLNDNGSVSQDYIFITQAIPDITQPTAITDLAISDVSQSSLVLSWTAPSDASGVTSYDIRYSIAVINESNFSSATAVSAIPTPVQTGANQQQYISVGLIPGTNYYFAMKSVDSLGNISIISNTASATTLPASSSTSDTSSNNPGAISVSLGGGGGFIIYQLSDSIAPGMPSNFKADITDTQVSLSWLNPTDADFIRVRIIRKTNAQPASHIDGVLVYDGASQTFTDINLINNQSYYYSIYAYDSVPNYSIPTQLKTTPQSNITQTSTLSALSKILLLKLNQLSQIISSSPFSHLPSGIQEGDLVRGPDGIKVYIVNWHGYKRHIFNPAIFNMYGHFKWDQIKAVSQSTLNSLKSSDFYRADGDFKVFSLKEIDERKGLAQKRWMNFSGDKFTQLGYKWEQVFIINTKERDYYQEGIPLTEQDLK